MLEHQLGARGAVSDEVRREGPQELEYLLRLPARPSTIRARPIAAGYAGDRIRALDDRSPRRRSSGALGVGQHQLIQERLDRDGGLGSRTP